MLSCFFSSVLQQYYATVRIGDLQFKGGLVADQAQACGSAAEVALKALVRVSEWISVGSV